MSIQTILAASQSMTRMQTMQSAQTQLQGTANVLRIESKQDGGNEKKIAKAEELEEKSTKLMGDLMTETKDINETLKPSEDIKEEEVAKEEKPTEKTSKTDTLELSDSAIKHMKSETCAKVAVLEAVTYKADGVQTPSVPNNSEKTFSTTV